MQLVLVPALEPGLAPLLRLLPLQQQLLLRSLLKATPLLPLQRTHLPSQSASFPLCASGTVHTAAWCTSGTSLSASVP